MVLALTFGENILKGVFFTMLHIISTWLLISGTLHITFKSLGSNTGIPQLLLTPKAPGFYVLEVPVCCVKPLSPGSLEQWLTELTTIILEAKSWGSTKRITFSTQGQLFSQALKFRFWILPLERFFSTPPHPFKTVHSVFTAILDTYGALEVIKFTEFYETWWHYLLNSFFLNCLDIFFSYVLWYLRMPQNF